MRLTPLILLFALSQPYIGAANAQVPRAESGGEHSGGGNYREIQFKKIGYEIVDLLEDAKNIPPEFKHLPWKKLRKVIDTTHVEATDRILRPTPDGKPEPAIIKDMLNTPAKMRIEFNIDSWDLFPSGSRRAALVFHEYLCILKRLKLTTLDDTNYEISHHLYDHPAMKLYFDNTEIAQTITGDVSLDFPIACEYSYKGGTPISLGRIGFWKKNGVEKRLSFLQHNVDPDHIHHPFLQISIYDESDSDLQYMRLVPSAKLKSSIRFNIGWSKGLGHFPEVPEYDQSVAISPNFRFELSLDRLKLKLACRRVRLTDLAKPKDLGE